MLDFCGEHGIGAEVEVITAAGLNEASRRVVEERRALPLRSRHLNPHRVTTAHPAGSGGPISLAGP